MKTFKDRVAVITGGASGLGQALAKRFASEGMNLVLADIDEASLAKTANELRAGGVTVVTQRTDVSSGADVEQLARTALDAFGAAHIVCNNAGVAPMGLAWESTEADWRWVLGVNVWGVIHGVRAFTPLLLRQNDEGHIVNTASVAGLISPSGMAAYSMSKHAVVALSEALYHDLAARTTKVKCSVLCPAYFPSGIADSERSRPAEFVSTGEKSDEQRALEANLKKAVESGKLTAGDIANAVFESVRDERFYILPHPRIKPAIEARMRDILDESLPRDPLKIR
jgi:NAD(P)-dependent dehydrogenase (short-subunit alcohol dehydrogenase family)